ncbi:MAG: MYXO-CTERM sorting domain-containing protein [Bradymonadaceae bacterium]
MSNTSGRIVEWMGWRLRSRTAFLFLAVLVAACSNDGCGCDGFEEGPFPEDHYDKTVPLGAQVRVSSHGLSFLEDEVPNLLGGALPDGLSFCVPAGSESGLSFCHEDTICDDGSQGCQLEFAMEETRLVPTPPNFLHIAVDIGDVHERMPVTLPLGIKCWLNLYKKGNTNAPAILTANVPIEFAIDQQSPTKDLQIKIDDIDVVLDDLDYGLSNRGLLGCGLVSGTVKLFADGLLRGLIDDALKDQVLPMIREQLCRSCGDGDQPCPSNASCQDVDGAPMCLYDADDECVPILLGMEGKLLTNNLLGEYAQFEPANLDVMVRGADEATVDTGLSLAFRTGFQPEALDRCAPVDLTTRPTFDNIPLSPTINGEVRPHNGEPFMIGIGVHRRILQHAFWSAWAGGALCLQVGTETVDLLHTGTIGAVLPSVRALAESNAAIYLIVAPQKAPDVVFGENRVSEQGNNLVVDDGLITLEWDDLDVHFYGFVLERFTRLFTLRADVRLPVALVPDGDGSIIPAIGDIENALTNMRPSNYEILGEDPQRLIDLLPTLMGLAIPALMDSLSDPIELPELMGYRLVIGPEDMRGVDENEFLGIFADLEPVPPSAYRVALTTLVTHHEVELGRRTQTGIERPRVLLDVMGVNTAVGPVSSDEMEYSYRVGGGAWSLFGSGPRLEINNPVFTLQGSHRIDVRTRYKGEPDSVQLEPTTLDVLVDYEPPTVRAERIGTVVSLEGYDVVDGPADLRYRYRILDGQQVLVDWTEWSVSSTIELAGRGLPGRFTFDAEVRDRAGYVGEASRMMTLESSDEITRTTSPTGGCACASTSGTGGGEGLGWALGLLGLLWLSRRRRSIRRRSIRRRSIKASSVIFGLAILVVFLSSTACGGCSDEETIEARTCDDGCLANFVCDDGECVPLGCEADEECDEAICLDGVCTSGCRDDGQCGDDCADDEFGVCTGNQCACQTYCKDGCEETDFCCRESNSCQGYPDWCADLKCDKGFEPELMDRGTADPNTCNVDGGRCECVSLPPLPMGWYGLYGSFGVGGGVKAVSVHNRTYRDLMVGILDTNNQPTWHWVDGVPVDGEITGDLQGPRGGISARGTRVGNHTAMVVDDAGQIHVFYHDIDQKALKYARGNADGEFSMRHLDLESDAGFWTNAVLVDGQIHVVYAAYGADHQSEMRYFSFAADTDFAAFEVEPTVIYETTPADVRSGPAGYKTATGLFNEISVTEEGLLVVFYDHTIENVAWIEMVDGEWEMPQFLGTISGPYVSGRKDAEGVLHLAYMDVSIPGLVYWRSDSVLPELILDGARDTAQGWMIAEVGESVSLRLRSNGQVSVVFQDATRHILYGGERSEAGAWTVAPIGGGGEAFDGSHGFFAITKAHSAGYLIGEFVINNQSEPSEAYPVFYEVP